MWTWRPSMASELAEGWAVVKVMEATANFRTPRKREPGSGALCAGGTGFCHTSDAQCQTRSLLVYRVPGRQRCKTVRLPASRPLGGPLPARGPLPPGRWLWCQAGVAWGQCAVISIPHIVLFFFFFLFNLMMHYPCVLHSLLAIHAAAFWP